jgi:hypothetical protein
MRSPSANNPVKGVVAMKKKWILGFVLLALSLAVTPTAALAAPQLDLHFEVLEYIGTSGESFVASGDSVDAGRVCATGTVDDLVTQSSGPKNGGFAILRVLKRFHCGDGSGTFDVRLIVNLNLVTHYTTAKWIIVDGMGDYVNLKGNGTLTGTPVDPGISIFDVYDGNTH